MILRLLLAVIVFGTLSLAKSKPSRIVNHIEYLPLLITEHKVENIEPKKMDNLSKPLTFRMEKRKKWLKDKRQLSKLRVRRAKKPDGSDGKKEKLNEAAVTVSDRGFKTKFNVSSNNKMPSKSNQNSQNKLKRKQSGKDSHVNLSKNDTKTSVKVKVKPVAVEEKMEEKNETAKTKKTKTEIADAVQKLENSTSVHIPKRYVLFVGNLPEDVTKEQVEEHFRKTGGVKSVRIPRDRNTDQPKGFAYVEFNNTISHRIALRLHNTTLGGHKIIVEFTSNGKVTKKQLESIKEREINKETLTPLKMPFET